MLEKEALVSPDGYVAWLEKVEKTNFLNMEMDGVALTVIGGDWHTNRPP